MERPTLSLGFLASHNGSSMRYIHKSIEEGKLNANIKVVISNNSMSKSLEFARENGIRAEHVSSKTHENPDSVISEVMLEEGIDYIILSGYMKPLGKEIVNKFEGKIINTHPADPKKYGGHGMYGDRVHEAVLKAGEVSTYPTAHLVDLGIDTGKILAQSKVDILTHDSIQTLSEHVKSAEGPLLLGVLQNLASNS